ncbi:protealysin inhibitor emfourin [Streptomyces axinellae]|uniref:Metalloprotease n=1 Tax=Streptomyces axinellae TaxID=552788 RepID=A0ABP6C0P8_9ACTN
MRITVIRTGGFGGLTRRATLDTAGLSDAPEIAELARDALLQGLGEPPTGVPDGFHYEIKVDDSTAHCADPKLTDSQRELVRRVLKEGA